MDFREVLEAKYDELEAASDGAAPVAETVEATPTSPLAEAEPAPPSDETAEQKAERARDESGRFAKEEKKPAAKTPPVRASPASSPTAGVKGGAAAVSPAPVAPLSPVLKAPQSWKPALREKFAALSPEFQQEILRRERETSIALQKAAEEAKGATPWTEAIRPYEAQIRAAGVPAHQYVGNLLQTAHALSYGPVENKAAILADIIAQFRVPPDLLDRALAAKLSGQPLPQAPQQTPQEFRDPRLDKLLESAQQRQESEATERTQAFGESHEFYEDVKDHMADILDVWAKQGKTSVTDNDLDRAYTLACQLNPDVAPLLEQRKAAEAAQKAAASTARARTAASSPKNSPSAAPAAQPKGMRAVLEAKADELGI
jgi:hypothetical protein